MNNNLEGHPGYAIFFVTKKTWLCHAHGAFEGDAVEAFIFKSEDEARRTPLLEKMPIHYQIREAWEPLCERLRNQLFYTENVARVTPEQWDALHEMLEEATRIAKGAADIKKKHKEILCLKCDHCQSENPRFECMCRRCQREPADERFYSCDQHVGKVQEKHMRIRGTDFEPS